MKVNEEKCEICGKKQHWQFVCWPFGRDKDGTHPQTKGKRPFDTAYYKDGRIVERLTDRFLKICPEADFTIQKEEGEDK